MMKLLLTTFLSFSTLLLSADCNTFIKENFGDNYSAIKREVSEDDLFNEGKIADIHYVISANNRTIAVVKEFDKGLDSQGDFQKELNAYYLLEKSSNNFFNTPKLLKSGEDSDHYYLMLSVAAGENLYHWLKEGSLDQLLEGVELSGQALRKFHSRLIKRPLKENIARKYNRAKLFDKFIDKPSIGIKEVKDHFLTTKFTLGQVHGDLHPGNVFYDDQSKEVTFIDFSTLTNPVKTMKGDPIAADAMKYLTSLQSVAYVYGYRCDEIKEIEEAFFKGYGRDLLSDEEIDLFKTYYALDLMDLIQDSQESSPLRKKQFAKLYEYATTWVVS
ncbi:MAG: aminoglycoside phosphotransferase family protein [Rhabdochlamydiaceae bacterium]|nr:aminoglycoside phosphotransferase family protein [Candidatus Amphrikana amoebophyrae]